MRPLSFCVKGDKHPMEEIIVIRATDPDGSMFKAVIDALQERKVEVINIAASLLRNKQIKGNIISIPRHSSQG